MLTARPIIDLTLETLQKAHAYTYAHSLRTANLAFEIASALAPEINGIIPGEVYDAALLHDIGKLDVPITILDKEGPLTPHEMKKVQLHPLTGAARLSTSTSPYLQRLSRTVLEHHERPDGKGYPFGLTLDEIAWSSRIVHLADRYVAMTEVRSYRKAMAIEEVFEILRPDIRAFFGRRTITVVAVIAEFGRTGTVDGRVVNNALPHRGQRAVLRGISQASQKSDMKRVALAG